MAEADTMEGMVADNIVVAMDGMMDGRLLWQSWVPLLF